jgi:FAD/FMN-containing dehydrogenase
VTERSLSATDVRELRSGLDGDMILPGDPGYDERRTGFYGGFDRRPTVIVEAANSKDVSRVVTLAGEKGSELAVRSGGHSTAGHSTTEGILLDLRRMDAVEIDPGTGIAWAESGITAGDYTTAAAAHDLATGFGDTASVGVGGITLAGGIGYLVRKHGLTIDSLLAAEIVTADGEVRHVDGQSHPDLFWAIRGGGGNFGVATRLQFRLHPVNRVIGGMMALPATPEVIAGFVAEADAAPDGLSTIANVMVAPPLPFFPEVLHGELIVLATMAWTGNEEEGERVISRIRSLAPPLLDMIDSIPYPQLFPPEQAGFHPIVAGHTMFVPSIDVAAAETIVEYLIGSDAPMRVAQVRVLGGAMARVPAEATAFAHRTSPVMANVAAFAEGPDDLASRQAWVADFAAALHPAAGAYTGFMGDEGPDRVRAAFPGATWDRLRAVKRRYDPDNLFRLNQNIPPG